MLTWTITRWYQAGRPADGRLVATLVQRIAGISGVAYSLAFCQAVERALGVAVPAPAERWRAVHAELERMANHLEGELPDQDAPIVSDPKLALVLIRAVFRSVREAIARNQTSFRWYQNSIVSRLARRTTRGICRWPKR